MKLSKIKLLEAAMLLTSAAGVSLLVLRAQKIAPGQPVSPATFTPARAAAPPTSSEVSNIDGSQKLIMKKASLPDGASDYVFSVVDNSGQRLLFTKALGREGSMTLPPNSWSPDGNYVFVSQTDGSSTSFLVFKTDGSLFPSGQKYLDVGALFAKTKTPFRLRDVTGWDSPDLLHVLTVTDQAAHGPKYWFEVGSGAFLQLAS